MNRRPMDFRLANYHTHTVRCQHAAPDSEEDYVRQAIRSGYEILGFADHSAWPYKSDFVANMRMHVHQLDGYAQAVHALQDRYARQIRIHCALECEAFPEFYPWLREVKEEKGLDYLILGNHYDTSDERGGAYFGRCQDAHAVYRYMETTIAGMESGLFAYLAHPDLFLNRYPRFDGDAKRVCRELCAASKRLNMPLEYNLLGRRRSPESRARGFLGYSSPEFWELAAEEGGVRAIIGVDAHAAAHLDCVDTIQEIRSWLSGMGIEVLDVLEGVEAGEPARCKTAT